MNLKRNEEQITENQLFATHNLEVPGSSPGWSTNKKGCIPLGNTAFFICKLSRYKSVALDNIGI
jgi:hypothetical protein